jgi:hypothetical protein
MMFHFKMVYTNWYLWTVSEEIENDAITQFELIWIQHIGKHKSRHWLNRYS